METGTTWYDDKTMEYHWVKPTSKYIIAAASSGYQATATFDHYDAWLTQTFGPSGWWFDDATKWISSDRKYYFKEEADRMLFLLKFADE